MLRSNPPPKAVMAWILLALLTAACRGSNPSTHPAGCTTGDDTAAIIIQLPEPDTDGTMPLEAALAARRSVRDFLEEPLIETQISQLLWAAQGITHPNGYRTAPSAGALYPLEVYTATADGLFHYKPEDHALIQTLAVDPKPWLYEAALEQDSVLDAPLVIVITGVISRTSIKYGEDRSPLYVHLEAGHAAQNILLQAVTLGLGAVPIGGFYEARVKDALCLPEDHTPLYLIPVGKTDPSSE